jgi:hypothetical protein
MEGARSTPHANGTDHWALEQKMCRCSYISGWRSRRWRNWQKVRLFGAVDDEPVSEPMANGQWGQEVTMRWGAGLLRLPTWALVCTCIYCTHTCLRLVRQH